MNPIEIKQTPEDVAVFSAGGTFEKVYPKGAGARDLVFGDSSAAEEMVQRLGLYGVTVDYMPHQAKDSLDMTDADRSMIAAFCVEDSDKCIVIIHGTDTMVETARYLASFEIPKTIVLTGSLQPACMKGSDAEGNFVSAVLASRLMGRGVWICMHGELFPYDSCRKNPDTGYFESLPPSIRIPTAG
ncbi:MAG: hypothetical protein RL150_185 [Candidatus Parcubacteria bacterium]|jgi:L-asparaginase